MQLHLSGGVEVYLDGLILETILSTFKARDLAQLALVCQSLRAPAQLAAHRSLVLPVKRLQGTLLRHLERGSWIAQLREWEALALRQEVWFQAEPAHTVVAEDGELKFVKRIADLSGRGNFAASNARSMPAFRPAALNGHPVIDFDGASLLKTRAFAEAIPQPITLMLVARARGDTTMVDSLTPQCAPRPPANALHARAHRRRCRPRPAHHSSA